MPLPPKKLSNTGANAKRTLSDRFISRLHANSKAAFFTKASVAEVPKKPINPKYEYALSQALFGNYFEAGKTPVLTYNWQPLKRVAPVAAEVFKIKPKPVKTLNIPNVQDDYYRSVLSTNVNGFAVALDGEVYFRSQFNGAFSRFDAGEAVKQVKLDAEKLWINSRNQQLQGFVHLWDLKSDRIIYQANFADFQTGLEKVGNHQYLISSMAINQLAHIDTRAPVTINVASFQPNGIVRAMTVKDDIVAMSMQYPHNQTYRIACYDRRNFSVPLAGFPMPDAVKSMCFIESNQLLFGGGIDYPYLSLYDFLNMKLKSEACIGRQIMDIAQHPHKQNYFNVGYGHWAGLDAEETMISEYGFGIWRVEELGRLNQLDTLPLESRANAVAWSHEASPKAMVVTAGTESLTYYDLDAPHFFMPKSEASSKSQLMPSFSIR